MKKINWKFVVDSFKFGFLSVLFMTLFYSFLYLIMLIMSINVIGFFVGAIISVSIIHFLFNFERMLK